MLTVVIPALNEERRIASVVEFAWKSPRVREVLVVDNGSSDQTQASAKRAGARVVECLKRGKGSAMQAGVEATSDPHLLFLDGDLAGLHPKLIERMSEPLFQGKADFVKAKFKRAAGRVTQLTAKPLLEIFFPELSRFEQPLGGVLAANRTLLRQLSFERDYGVDLALLIDALMRKARLTQVDVGHLHHESQTLEQLSKMARQVVRTLMVRARRYGRMTPPTLAPAIQDDAYTFSSAMVAPLPPSAGVAG